MEIILNAEQMREADTRTIRGLLNGNGLLLMEHAGTACVRRLAEKFGNGLVEKPVAVLAGTGNNGGDGMVIARQLVSRGVSVTLFLCGDPERLSPDALHQMNALYNYPVDVVRLKEPLDKDFTGRLDEFPIVVDAMLGTGINSSPRGVIGAVVKMLADHYRGFILSVDIPTGLATDRSMPPGISVQADETVTFGARKPCHLLYPAADRAGVVTLDTITIPESIVHDIGPDIFAVNGEDVLDGLPEEAADSHKGTFGHVGIIGGRRGRLGAGILAGRAALRAGCGLVTVKLDDRRYDAVAALAAELMFDLTEPALDGDVLSGFAEDKDVILVGPGFGTDEQAGESLTVLLDRVKMPMVLDADVFHLLGPDSLKKRLDKRPAVLTPHPGEMSALLGITVKDVQSDRLSVAREAARQTGAVTVLKGAGTVIAEPGGRTWINTTGNPGMGTAGSGDVLGGMIASLMARGMDPVDAAVSGVYLHGLAGDMMKEILTESCITASDLIDGIPLAFGHISGHA